MDREEIGKMLDETLVKWSSEDVDLSSKWALQLTSFELDQLERLNRSMLTIRMTEKNVVAILEVDKQYGSHLFPYLRLIGLWRTKNKLPGTHDTIPEEPIMLLNQGTFKGYGASFLERVGARVLDLGLEDCGRLMASQDHIEMSLARARLEVGV